MSSEAPPDSSVLSPSEPQNTSSALSCRHPVWHQDHTQVDVRSLSPVVRSDLATAFWPQAVSWALCTVLQGRTPPA